MKDSLKEYAYGNPSPIGQAFQALGNPDFYPSTPRYNDALNKDIIVTEKLDGCNMGVIVDKEKDLIAAIGRTKRILPSGYLDESISINQEEIIKNGNKNNYILPSPYTDDYSYGIYSYVNTNRAKLIEVLGTGIHFGEWVGKKINRSYDMSHREFVLFNTNKWEGREEELKQIPNCSLVPVLYKGMMLEGLLPYIMDRLKQQGSVYAPNYMNPEGIVIAISALRMKFKMTFQGDSHKWQQEGKPDKRPPPSPLEGFFAKESYAEMIEAINSSRIQP